MRLTVRLDARLLIGVAVNGTAILRTAMAMRPFIKLLLNPVIGLLLFICKHGFDFSVAVVTD